MIDAYEPELTTVHVSAGRGGARLPVLRRAVAGTCAKAGLTLDRIDDALLILEALLGDPRTARSDEVQLVLTARPGALSILVGPLADGEADRLLARADLPLVGPVIEHLASTAVTVEGGTHLSIVVEAL